MNKKRYLLKIFIILFVFFSIINTGIEVYAQTNVLEVNTGLIGSEEPEDFVSSIKLMFLFTILTLAPSILVMMTSFTRILIVLSFIRSAIGLQQTPPNQVIIGLALFLTFFVMAPVAEDINEGAIVLYMEEELDQESAIEEGMKPVREFMFKQTRDKDLNLFLDMKGLESVKTLDEIPTHVLIPGFIISELKTAFQVGFIIYIPFLVIDMIVASTLMAMGMMMLPPVIISLPFKILLFVLIDGWNVIVKSLILGFK